MSGTVFTAMRTFSEALHEALSAKGWTAYRLAERAGINRSGLSVYLSGQRVPEPATIDLLVEALGVDGEELHALADAHRLGPSRAAGISKYAAAVAAPADTKILGSTKSGHRTKAGTTSGLQEDGLWLVPVYGPVAAGDAIMWTSEDARSMAPIDIDLADDVDAIFVIRGNSVSDYGVFDGDRVYARRLGGETLPSGQMVIVECEGAYYCKIYRENALGRYLESHEAGKEPVPFPLTGDVRIIAIVTYRHVKHRRRV